MSEESLSSVGQITHLLLENFKAFKHLQRIPIRPITLIYGKNNSGKSSIIQALLYAEEARSGNIDPSVVLKGNHRMLEGGLARLVHGHGDESQARLGWEWVNPGSPTGCVAGRYEQDLYGYEGTIDTVVFTASLNGIELLSAKDWYRGYFALPEINWQHPAYRSAVTNVQRILAEEFQVWIREGTLSQEMDKLLKSACRRLECGGFDSAIGEVLSERIVIDERSLPQPLVFIRRPAWDLDQDLFLGGTSLLAADFESASRCFNRPETPLKERLSSGLDSTLETHVENYIAERCAYIVYQWFTDVLREFERPLDQLVQGADYLAAVRSRPETVFFRDHRALKHAGILRADSHEERRSLAPQHPDWAAQRSAIDQANLWLRENKLLTGNIELRLDEAPVNQASNNLPGVAPAATLSLFDRDRNVSLSFTEVGYGLSQFIPVLLACLTQPGTLLVEEPEAHIHPALQSEIGDLFIEVVTCAEPRPAHVICETHSEHLLLRIMRRIREGKLSPQKVAVLYVENLGEESMVREMPLNEKGELIRDWPGGFFEEGLRDLLV